MPEKDAEDIVQKIAKARLFFETAQKAAEINNFDYAIDMYLEGLRCSPDEVLGGHIRLRELAIFRQGKGGKKPSVVERVKYMRGKTHLEQMLNAEYLFAKDPDHLPYAGVILKAALAGGYKKTARWIADFLFQVNSASKKPSLETYLLLKDSYEAIGHLDRAVVACQFAIGLRPEDKELGDEYRRLSAELTVSKGKYDQEGDFRQSIRDREGQEKLQAQDFIIKSEDYRALAVEEAQKAIAEEPNLPINIFNLAEALSDLQSDQADAEAIELLENTYKKTNDFSFQRQAGQIRMKQLRRKIREAQTVLESKPDDAQAKSMVAELSAQLDEVELEHCRLCVKNYPTDLQAKYEYGICLLRNKQYDQAIPLFQEAQRDPRRKILAMDKIGLCFFLKGWFTDAIDIFTAALNSYELKDDSIAKELRYNLARAYEQQGQTAKALEIYRKIAQLDFSFKDVSQRVDKLREKST